MRPFLNIDAGEHPDEPEALYALAHAVSVACGGHAGDEASMERVVRACVRTATRIGAHPSYDDREGFGRRELDVSVAQVDECVREQCARLLAVAQACGGEVTHLKPHGALYHAANRDPAIARAVIVGARLVMGSVAVLGPPDGELRRAAEGAGLVFVREGFADRAMRPDGSLVARGEPGAILATVEAVRAQTRALAASGAYETLCVHADSPGALALARAAREVLDE